MTLENLNYTAIDIELVYKILNKLFCQIYIFYKKCKRKCYSCSMSLMRYNSENIWIWLSSSIMNLWGKFEQKHFVRYVSFKNVKLLLDPAPDDISNWKYTNIALPLRKNLSVKGGKNWSDRNG